MNRPDDQPLAAPQFVASETTSEAALALAASGPAAGETTFDALNAPAEAPPLRSPDGRVQLTEKTLTVRGQPFGLLELERVELTPVRWLLWYLLGGLGLAAVLIAFLQNELRTGPAMLGVALTALLLAYGHRGTNRLRLHRLGREAVNFALPGEPEPWQRLCAEANRRLYRAHDRAAHEAAALLAAADEAVRQAALAAAQAEPCSTTPAAGPDAPAPAG